MDPVKLTVKEVRLFEREVRLRLPFRFGVVTLTEAPQAYARVRVALEDGREGWGMAAEMLAPKWFDKNTDLSNEQNFDQLRRALGMAREAYLAAGATTAFGLMAGSHRSLMEQGRAAALNPLLTGYGPALLDRAVLDALCRLHDTSFERALQADLPGIEPAALAPELRGFPFASFLQGLRTAETIHARHTVGMTDPLTGSDRPAAERVNDGLPETLEEVVAAYGNRYFKVKVRGEAAADQERLRAIAAVLDQIPEPYFVTLDGNEQFHEVEGVLELVARIEEEPRLRRFWEAVLFIEQPVHRAEALAHDFRPLAEKRPVIIDESDGDFDAFPLAREKGYEGVSSKSCKGFYKSLVNAARCALWNAETNQPRFFMSGEDLTCIAGLTLQQDLLLASFLGLTHLERNGHHYVRGMATAPPAEQERFAAAHPDLYRFEEGAALLRVERGEIRLGSLACPGFGSAAEPDWSSLREMTVPQSA